MEAIVLLNCVTGTVEFIILNDEQAKELEEKYDNDVELWFDECFDHKGAGINLSDCSWMHVKDFPEIYEHRKKGGKWYETQIFTTY